MLWKYNIAPEVKEFELHHNPVIVTVNKFDEDSAKEFRTKVAMAHNTGQKIIPVIIDSYGGQVYSLMSMISTIKNSELPIATIVEGKAMSCGAILLSFGTEGYRFVDKDATVMIHDVSSGQLGKVEEVVAEGEAPVEGAEGAVAAEEGKPSDEKGKAASGDKGATTKATDDKAKTTPTDKGKVQNKEAKKK